MEVTHNISVGIWERQGVYGHWAACQWPFFACQVPYSITSTLISVYLVLSFSVVSLMVCPDRGQVPVRFCTGAIGTGDWPQY